VVSIFMYRFVIIVKWTKKQIQWMKYKAEIRFRK